MKKLFFSPLSFIAVFGSGIRDGLKSESVIRDKHPGSATLHPALQNMTFIIFFPFLWVIFALLDSDPNTDQLT
jgi:hypothetical protein